MNAVSSIVYSASMQNKPVWSSQLRAATVNPAGFASAFRLAESMGVQVKGQLTYNEWQAVQKAVGQVR